jgi:hypothetical protein
MADDVSNPRGFLWHVSCQAAFAQQTRNWSGARRNRQDQRVKGALGKASRIHVITKIFKRRLTKVGKEMGVRMASVPKQRSARHCACRAKTHASKGRHRLVAFACVRDACQAVLLVEEEKSRGLHRQIITPMCVFFDGLTQLAAWRSVCRRRRERSNPGQLRERRRPQQTILTAPPPRESTFALMRQGLIAPVPLP